MSAKSSSSSNKAWAPESSAAFWINHTSRTVLRLHDSRLRPLGLSMGQLPVLIALEEKGALSQRELTALARVEQPTMAELLSRMERDGLVAREPNPDDKRGTLASLTRTGRARLAKAKDALVENEALATTGFTKAEKTALLELLQRVVQNLDESAGECDPTSLPRRRAT